MCHLYSESLVSRENEVDYVYSQVVNQQAMPEQTVEHVGDSHGLMKLRCVAFWAFSYSLYDIFARVMTS